MVASQTPPLLTNLRPALAGLVVDHEIGSREAYATFINLVERGYIDMRKEGKYRIFFGVKRDLADLKPFEIMVLPPQEGISGKLLMPLLYSVGSDYNFVNSVLAEANAQGIYASNAKYSGKPRDLNYLLIFALPAFALTILSFLPDPKGNMNRLMLLSWALLLLAICATIFLRSTRSPQDKAKPSGSSFTLPSKESQMSARGSSQRQRYLDLLQWLEANPLKNYQWSNEFLPYAVAFGLYKDYTNFPK